MISANWLKIDKAIYNELYHVTGNYANYSLQTDVIDSSGNPIRIIVDGSCSSLSLSTGKQYEMNLNCL